MSCLCHKYNFVDGCWTVTNHCGLGLLEDDVDTDTIMLSSVFGFDV